jgi:hypothetical protein
VAGCAGAVVAVGAAPGAHCVVTNAATTKMSNRLKNWRLVFITVLLLWSFSSNYLTLENRDMPKVYSITSPDDHLPSFFTWLLIMNGGDESRFGKSKNRALINS